MLKFKNLSEVMVALYILLDLVIGYLIVKTSSNFVPILVFLVYEVMSWLTFKRKTVEHALNRKEN